MLSNLLSGLIGAVIGAVIGGYLSYLGAIKAAERSAEILFKQDAKRQELERDAKKAAIVNGLVDEIGENIELADQNQISHAKIKFITDAWATAKGNLFFLDETLQSQLQKAYVSVHKYNALVDYDSAKVDYGRGYLDDELKRRVQAAKDELVACKASLVELKIEKRSLI